MWIKIALANASVYCSLFTGAMAAHANEPRIWTSADGKFTIEAELVEVLDDAVRLRKSTGSVITVPFAKLSDADRAHARRLQVQRFELPGVMWVGVPKNGFAWKVVQEAKEGEAGATVLACNKTGSDSVIVLTIENRKVGDDGQRIAAIKGHFNGLVEGLQAAGIKILRVEKPSLATPVPKRVSFSVSAEKPDGSPAEVRGILFFGERIYGFQVVSNDNKEADELAKVARTLKELRADRTAPQTQ